MTQDEREAAVKLIGKWRQDFASGTREHPSALRAVYAGGHLLDLEEFNKRVDAVRQHIAKKRRLAFNENCALGASAPFGKYEDVPTNEAAKAALLKRFRRIYALAK